LNDHLIDTGFDAVIAGEVWSPPDPPTQAEQITVAVNPPAEPAPSPPAEPPSPVPTGLTTAGVQAAKALVQLPDLDWPTLSKLAREIAMDIKERAVILKEFKLTQAQYDFLEENNDFYKQALANSCREWHAPLTTQERIKVEAAAILEDSLLILGARMQNKGEGLPGVVEAAKLFAKVAGVGEREGSVSAPGERFTINIDLGGDKNLTVSTTAPASTPQGGDLRGALPPVGEAS
jgi:hypothetical protein